MQTVQIGLINRTRRIKKAEGQKKFNIWIDGKIFYFSSEREANAFVGQVKTNCNLVLSGLNNIYIELFSMHRQTWFFIGDPTRKINHYKQHVETKKKLDQLEFHIERSIYPFNPALGNDGVRHLKHAIKCSKSIVESLKSFYQKKGLHALRKTLLFYKSMIETMEGKLIFTST